jgi:hypothetical protein
MKISTLNILFLFIHLTGFGQKPFKEYLDKNEVKTDSVDKAEFYRVGTIGRKGNIEGELRTYYKNGNLKRISHYLDGTANGEVISYYPNGQRSERKIVRGSVPEGKYESWYPNGQKKEEGEWERRGSPKYMVYHFWDSTGVQTLTNGTGELIEYNEQNRMTLKETYKNGLLVKGINYGDKEYTYHTYREQLPEFPGGMAALKIYLNQNIRYPKIDKRFKNTGKVWVEFVIQADGSIKDVKTQGPKIGFKLEEAICVISEMPAWQPGLQYGRPVPVRYTMPITFNL